MRIGRWRRAIYRFFHTQRRPSARRTRPVSAHASAPWRGWVLAFVAALVLAGTVIGVLEYRMRPILAAVAQARVSNSMTAVVGGAITEDLTRRGVDYTDFVTIERSETGAIAALSTNMASMNLLRTQLVGEVITALEGVDISEIDIPLGSLIDSELLWAKGPSIKVRSMTVGTVSSEFKSEFTAAGINQTLHRIYLNVHVPLTIMLPGGAQTVEVDSRLCVAETVIVGQVPDAFLQMDFGNQ